MTAAQRLAQLSGLSGVSAAEHLRKIAGVAGAAGAMLVAYSGLTSGTAADHLLTDRQAVIPPIVSTQGTGGGAGGGGGWGAEQEDYSEIQLKQALEEDEIIVMAIAKLVATGALG